MKKTTRKRYSPQFKLQVAMEAFQEKEPLSVLAQRHSIHPTQITQWKKQLKEKLKDFFTTGRPSTQTDEKLTEQLYQKIGKLEMELDWLKKKYDRYQQKTGLDG
jgi:transposase-like protein